MKSSIFELRALLCLNLLNVELERCQDVADAAGQKGMEIVNPVIISTMINTGT